jgi:endonuclease III
MDNEFKTSLGIAMESILYEYENKQEPFDRSEGVISSIISDFETEREKALFKTLTTALNYQRDAREHYRTFGELWYDEHWLFEPEEIAAEKSLEEIEEVFEKQGIRFPNKDAKIWYDISLILSEEYNSNPLKIFEEDNYDLTKVEETARASEQDIGYLNPDFPYLRGEKIRPLWIRLMQNHLPEQQGYENTEVAVDTHIINITNRICGTDYEDKPADKEEIRRFWREVCDPVGIIPIKLDYPLWLINREWEDWGEEYLREKLREESIELS